ncbi:MAG: hypothetical protein JWQ49_4612 [Edaphobacter sp.]|nr:hypothetical protein [Edaphobacter sp.]
MPNSVSRPTVTRRRFTQLSGMAVGDEVVKTASDAIHSGDAVRVQNLTSAAK